MKNLPTYEQFLVEATPNYTFDGDSLKLGSTIVTLDGYSGMIVSKETSNGKVVFRDNKGTMHVCESQYMISCEESEINENLQWWEVTKGVLASDMIKAGNIAGGGISAGGSLFNNWRKGLSSKVESLRKNEKFSNYKKLAEKVADKFNSDETLKSKLQELEKYPHTKSIFSTGKRKFESAKKTNEQRYRLMREIANYVKSKLESDEVEYFTEINKILKGESMQNEENALSLTADITRDPQQVDPQHTSINNDPNRTVGTGTYTSTWHDVSPMTKGFWDPKDPSSAGTIPTYVGN
jgi:hypothetical protein